MTFHHLPVSRLLAASSAQDDRLRRHRPVSVGCRLLALGLLTTWLASGSAARADIITRTYNSWRDFPNNNTLVLESISPVSGRIWVPSGQGRLIIKIPNAQSMNGDFCNLTLYVTKDVPLSITYGSPQAPLPSGFVYSFGPPGAYGAKWEGGLLQNFSVTIENPAPGYYYFAPWQYFYSVGSPLNCDFRWALHAEYSAARPGISRITPTQQEKDLGGSASIAVNATGQVDSYHWQQRRSSINWIFSGQNPSAATATLSLANLTTGDDAEYRAIVRNSGGSSTSAWSRLIVRLPPTITAQPQPRKVMPGNSATFSVTATGTAPLTYQWQQRDLDGNVRNLSGANSSGLTLNNVAYPARAGAYRVLVMNAANPAGLASAWASLTIGPDILSLSPANPSVTEGNSITLTASANGTAPLVYNWWHDGQLRQSGGSTQLILASTREQDDGSWRLDVTNAAGKESQTFTLEVIPPPTPPNFILSPSSEALTEGETLRLNSRALGTRPISYHWFHDGNPAGSGATLQIPNAGPEHAGQWQVRATNSLGHDQSAPATVSVSPGPRIIRQPVGAEVSPGSTVTLSVEAIGRAPIGYGWFKNGQPLGVSGSELILNNVSPADSGSYLARVTNGLGQMLSSQPARVLVQAGAVPPGTLLWKFPCPQPSQIVLHDDGRLVFMDAEGLKSLDEHGLLEWTFPRTSGPDAGFKQLLAAPGGVTIVNGNFQPIASNRVFAFGPQGQVLWSAISTNQPPTVVFDSRYPGSERVERDDVTQIALGANGELVVARVYAWRYSNIHAGPDGLHLGLYALTQDEAVTGSLERPLRISKFPKASGFERVSFTLAIDQNEQVRSAQYGQVTVTFPSYALLGAPYFRTVYFGAVDGEIPMSAWYDRYRFFAYLAHRRLLSNAYLEHSLWQRSWLTESGNFYGHHWVEPTVYAIGMNAQAYIGSGNGYGSFVPQGALYRFHNSGSNDRWYREVRKPFRSEIGGGYPVINRASEVVRPVLHEISHNVKGLAKDRLVGFSFEPRLGPERVWYYGQIRSTAALADDGTTYGVGWSTNATSLHALNSDGQKLWEFVTAVETNGVTGPEENSPTIGADGTVYFPGGDAVYAIKGTSPIMDSSWPVYGGNVRRTWRAQELPKVPELALPSQFIVRGAAMTLNGDSTGPEPMRYQWLKDGERLSGETNATLAVSDLRGFDSGRYQVRVSNPTGDRLSQPAQLKVVFDPAPFVDVVHTPEAAFTNVPPSANTRRADWQFFHGINETNRTGRYARLIPFLDPWQTPGLVAWAALSTTSAIGFNTSAAPVVVLGASAPAGRVFLHPGTNSSNCVGLGWQAEVAGYYAMTGRLSRLAVDASGDGVRWHLDLGTLNVLSGTLPSTGTDTILALSGIYLNRGERLHLILSPGDNGLGDLTGVELAVRLTEPDPNSEPGFLQSPQNLAVRAGQNATFSAWVDGAPQPALQWQHSVNNGATWEALVDGPDYTGVNATNLEVFAVTTEANGQLFRLEAINAAGSAVSGAARLAVTDGPVAPSFVMQPQAAMTISGGLVILSARASGTGPLDYQWYRDGTALSGQTEPTLTLNAASPADAGAYYAVVANALGSQTSAVAVVTVDLPPPPSVLGLAATETGVAVGLRGQAGSAWNMYRSPDLAGPWTPLAQVSIPPPTAGELLGDVFLADSNPPPDMAFYAAVLALPPTLPAISAQPVSSTTFHEGGDGVLSIVVEGVSPISYQWWQGGVPLAGETNQTLTIYDVTTNRAGYYFAVVSNAYGAVTSSVAVVTVEPAPFIVKVDGILVTATSEGSAYGRYASNVVNGVTFDAYFWQTTHPDQQPVVPLDRAPAITFDLQGVYRLDQVPLWNGHEPPSAVKRMRVEYSRDGITFESFGEVELSPGTATEEPSDVVLLDQVEARIIRFSILENYHGQQFPFVGATTNHPSVAIDEVEFYGELVAPLAPEITTHPTGETNCLEGVSFTLRGAAIGTWPLSYQWWLNGHLVPNETNRTLVFNPLTLAHAGRYNLVVSNGGGEAISGPALIPVVTNTTTLPDLGGLLAYYALNNSTDDLSGNWRHPSNFGATATRDRFGLFGGAFAFTNASRMEVQGIDPDDSAGGFSFGCWFRPDAMASSQKLFYWEHTGTWGSTFLAYGPGSLSIRCGSGSSATDHDISGLTMPVRQWHHLMVTHGTSFDRVYLNGVPVAEWPTSALLNNSSTLWIGNNVHGALDDVTIFGRELTAADVLVLAAP